MKPFRDGHILNAVDMQFTPQDADEKDLAPMQMQNRPGPNRTEFPTSKLVMPERSGRRAVVLAEEKCSRSPRKQNYGVCFVNKCPQKPEDNSGYVMVPLRTFKRLRSARAFRDFLLKHPVYRSFIPMIVRIGYWSSLPVASWLNSEGERVEFATAAVVERIEHDAKASSIRTEVMKRRRLEDPEKLREADEKFLKPKRVDIVDGEFTEREREQPEEVPKGQQHYLSAEEETLLLEKGSVPFDPIDDDEEDEQKGWSRPVDILKETQRYILLWVLPETQSPGQVFPNVAFAWLGAFSSMDKVRLAQSQIKKQHPDWAVYCSETGYPLHIPVRTWIMQDQNKMEFDQPMIRDLMQQEEFTPEMFEAQKRKEEERQVAQENAKQDMEKLLGKQAQEDKEKPQEIDGNLELMSEETKSVVGMTMKLTQFKKAED